MGLVSKLLTQLPWILQLPVCSINFYNFMAETAANSAVAASLFALYDPHLLPQQHQDMINCHSLYLARFCEVAKEVESLRQENTSLRSVNRGLNKQLSALIQTSVQNHFASSDYNTTPFELVNSLGGLCLGGDGVGKEEISAVEDEVDFERVMLPKSISVRFNGYLNMMSEVGAASHRGKTRGLTLAATANASQQISGATNMKQKFASLALPIQVERKEESALPIQVERKEASALPIQVERKEASALPIQVERKEVSTLPIQVERKEVSTLPIQVERKDVCLTLLKEEEKVERILK
ncbi:Zinc finger C-x8-C-x5-C-x3-H type family protein, putative isoform 3 [Hibiscus syriacus]|uniref:Zinc finger C-x8-C-x5-C-x3-H type family protein, putative isoform 3 n=1 Tax=Hibiscus syriacus TaxID=106335 RepID=A0A6A2XJ46_HIBSY|nr:Zinc finger C-x8-C-x5-C-x3-H type family protein, putative isoform 3 [Hibiscus syriacus]